MSTHPTSRETHFFDAANPHNVPSGLIAAVYVNGDFAWPQDEISRMKLVMGISVLSDPIWAEKARCLDIESHAAGVGAAVPFVRHRGEYLFRKYHTHINDAVVYVNRSNREEVQSELQRAGFSPVMDNTHSNTFREWVATLDGTDIIDAWACQLHTNGLIDTSVLHGINDFHRP